MPRTLLILSALWAATVAEEHQPLADETSLLQRSAAVSAGQPAAQVPLLQEHSQPVRHTKRTIPSVSVNLDLPPEDRWLAALGEKRLKRLTAPIALVSADRTLLEHVDFSPNLEILRELEGIVKAANNPRLTMSQLLASEVGYESGQTACTGLLAATSNGTVFHGRNLDLDPFARMPLESLTMDVTYYRGGKPLFSATTFSVSPGVHTGYRIGSYSVAQNTRDGCGDMERNVESAKRGGQPFTLLLRRVLEETATYEDAVHRLAREPLIAPQYFTMAGAGAWQGALVTRDRHGYTAPYPNVKVLNQEIGRWFIVQTNDDTWRPANDDRRPTALAKLSGLEPGRVTAEKVLEVMTTVPVLNPGTVFTWILEPSTGARRVFLGTEELLGDVEVPAFVSSIRPEPRQ